MMETMLVATDGSETARTAVCEAAELAAGTGARVHVMTAYVPLQGRVDTDAIADAEPDDWHAGQDSAAKSILGEACAAMRTRGVIPESHARPGDPADAILDLAEELETDLIVIGNKGLTGGRRFLLGSVPNKVSHHAPCSVLIVHTA